MFFSDLIKTIRELISAIVVVTHQTGSLSEKVLDELAFARLDLKQLRKAVTDLTKVLRLRKPGPVFLRVLQENDDMLVFVFMLPPLSAKDVVKRELTVQIGEQESQTVTIEGAVIHELVSPEFSGSDNDTVTASLVEIDDAGNRSEARDFEGILVDNLAPPKPGEFAIQTVREEDDTPPDEQASAE